MPPDTSPVEIAKRAVQHAKDHGNDIVFLDTAGRLHIDEVLMKELEDIRAEVNPDEILLTIDAMTGQDAVTVAKSFNEALTITGVILTKRTEILGAARRFRSNMLPANRLNLSEQAKSWETLNPSIRTEWLPRILGMGDMLSLIEKAEQAFDEKQAAQLEEKIMQNRFDFNDYLDNMKQIKNMGPIDKLLGMIPGVNAAALKDVQIDEKQIAHTEAMILSMTAKERSDPSIINASRKRRIAAGSGRTVEEVNRLLKGFDQMKEMMKRFGGKKNRVKKHKKKEKIVDNADIVLLFSMFL